MPITLKGVDKFASHVERVSKTAGQHDERTVAGLALKAKGVIVATATPRTLSRFNRGKGVKLGAKYVVRGGKPASASVSGTPPGAWGLLEKGGKAHSIARRGKGRFLGSADGTFHATGPVNHPAIGGKGTWTRSSRAAVAASHTSFGSVYKREYVNLFRG